MDKRLVSLTNTNTQNITVDLNCVESISEHTPTTNSGTTLHMKSGSVIYVVENYLNLLDKWSGDLRVDYSVVGRGSIE